MPAYYPNKNELERLVAQGLGNDYIADQCDTTPDVIRRLQAKYGVPSTHARSPAMVRRLQELLGHPPPKEEGSIF